MKCYRRLIVAFQEQRLDKVRLIFLVIFFSDFHRHLNVWLLEYDNRLEREEMNAYRINLAIYLEISVRDSSFRRQPYHLMYAYHD